MFKREKKVCLELTDEEYRLVRKCLMDWRNKLTKQGKCADPEYIHRSLSPRT